MTAGCQEAEQLEADGFGCPLSALIASWNSSGHCEREFQRFIAKSKVSCKKLHLRSSVRDFRTSLYVIPSSKIKRAFTVLYRAIKYTCDSWTKQTLFTSLRVARWCRDNCTLQPDRVKLDLSDPQHENGVIWPWDILGWMSENNTFLSWVHDDPSRANESVTEFWNRLSHLPFYRELQLENPSWTVPVAWHVDGVKVFKTHKVWVYSFSSCTRKGPSVDTKLLFLVLRDTMIIKDRSHDSVARVIGYCMDVLMTGNYPAKAFDGSDFLPDSLEAQRANRPFCNGWRFAFAAWKGDLEARVICHKLVCNWAADSICM